MANEITVNSSLCIDDGSSPTTPLQSGDVLQDQTTKLRIAQKITVGITATAIPVSGLTSPGWATFINRSTTHFIDLYTDNSGSKKHFARLQPGCPAGPFFLGVDCKAPYALADTAPCIMEFLILDT